MKIENDRYIRLIENAGIFSYSVTKGSFILPPRGFILWEQIKNYLDSKFKMLGIENVVLPTIIPMELLAKEKEHIEGFAPELFLVRKGSTKSENIEFALRPTSEVLFYEWFSRILHSYRQLPFLYNQWGQVFRVEKNTKPFLRNTEFLWQEGHTLHIDNSEAKSFTKKILDVYQRYSKEVLCLSIMSGLKTTQEKFAGAIDSYTIECLMPDNQCLQIATSHYFGQGFVQQFNVNFRDTENKLITPSSTSWGTSTRSIGALILAHADDRGLVFPFQIAPYQIAIIPYGENLDNGVSEYLLSLYNDLNSIYRCHIYQTSKQIGKNIDYADRDGCPFKIIVGFHESTFNKLTISLRTSSFRDKEMIMRSDVKEFIEINSKLMDQLLYQKSGDLRLNNTFEINDYHDFTKKIVVEKGIFKVPFCNIPACEIDTKKKFPSFSFRCIVDNSYDISKKCIFCDKEGVVISYFGRSY